MINWLTGNESGLEFTARRDWDQITRPLASIEKAGRILDYQPETRMEDGFNRVHDWIKGKLDKIEADVTFWAAGSIVVDIWAPKSEQVLI
jgi:hypothetical protein|tara:strand:+ start:302 stop:571 length:270 start_codon:yes stop_codon:yes gene_type:complete